MGSIGYTKDKGERDIIQEHAHNDTLLDNVLESFQKGINTPL